MPVHSLMEILLYWKQQRMMLLKQNFFSEVCKQAVTVLLGIFHEIAFLSGVYGHHYVDISSGITASTKTSKEFP